MKFILPTLFLILVVAGCGGSFSRPGEEKNSPKVRWPSDAYPLDLPEDLAVVPKEYPLSQPSDSARNVGSFIAHQRSHQDSATGPVQVYRIQIYNSNTYGPALKEFSVANEVFDGNTWLDYEVPYYKIRVGNFSTREEAEQYLPTVNDAGYPEAWVVRVNVNINTLEEPLFQPSADDTPGPLDKSMRQNVDSTKHQGN